ncbi:MAG: hypothetical protein AAFR59_20340, partial [Bacteroidota bacterium]
MKNYYLPLALCFIISLWFLSCQTFEVGTVSNLTGDWKRYDQNPVLRDTIPDVNYEVASDPHVFFDGSGKLRMIYSGDVGGNSSIKLASATSWDKWEKDIPLIFEIGPSGLDIQKETSFYRKSKTGKHQIYYIGYDDEETYQSQVYLAEADNLEGPYVQSEQPVVPVG